MARILVISIFRVLSMINFMPIAMTVASILRGARSSGSPHAGMGKDATRLAVVMTMN